MSTQKFATNSLHSGHDVTQTAGTRAVPIYQTTSYVFNDSEHAASLFSLKELGFIYTRLNNPTNQVLQERLASLEGGTGAVVFASGTAAISTSLLTLLKAGDHIVASSSLYGGTYNLLNVTLPRLGITTTFVDASNPDNFKKATQSNTRAFFVESLGNPKLDVLDLKAISIHAKSAEIPFIVDNTVATPALLNPIEHGANIVIHSLTKYIGGQGNSLGGVVIDAGTFNWGNGKFPEFTEPSPGYHGLIYHEALGASSYTFKLILEGLRDFGGALSPTNAFNIIQGLETLNIRIKKHSENALELAKWLEEQEVVTWVNYPGLESSNYHTLSQKYLPKGQSGIVTFGVKGGYDAAKVVADNTKLFSLLANIGDTKSLIIHPASTTHQQLSESSQKTAGVTNDLIRLSVGLEDIEDLKADLKQAFTKIK
ncbi:O-acetylhomoserine aminocarboxypropyltransferase/cysteine synthase family protein [Tenacibaculum maritimum]|uniref:O-acetylhomoserine aminocarboxypropyltransferase n=1 Tax=Tenacibaculum maritimum NCIMB 2154 TaxID=1349785 RepID=A0A2H1ECH7_9FLAO|nr:O-acetylhomoserine aminocarboxypropyltransferase/cysteine synthase family protein [Tenacibaculum maritimum]MCD9563892.1 O-acetylhomoserine aminocarboxypropyltransferase/cysteine synthase [Tenacibaculum maritimum]MCD9564842.1 O-acetylhomoserine aminocarboxypropyltransferase/cysteine synthase [Tenacibaculum maritimum]MCD9577621.1 O-acetylhomoserine aminocarboxypropyltransferase/cysteine synthase [Tenacibaculum maritimum]MCD9583642.1 O-acetylhomoserine aminocarboxypropyltransferase/cysteine syn